METTEAISARIDTTEDIRSVVRTMKSLSAVSIRRYEHAAAAIADYADTVELGLQVVLRDRLAAGAGLPAAMPGDPGARPVLIVLGSDRGLCGRFNDRIAEAALEALPEAGAPPPLLCVMGVRTASRLAAAGQAPDHVLAEPGSVGGIAATVQDAILQIDRWRREAGAGPVSLAFNRRSGGALAQPVHRQLLPLSAEYLEQLARRRWESRSLPMFTMDRGALLSWLLRQHLFVAIYRGLADSLASEHASRLAAMQSAERNIDERLDELSALHRQIRQEAITRELLDVIAGFESAQGTE